MITLLKSMGFFQFKINNTFPLKVFQIYACFRAQSICLFTVQCKRSTGLCMTITSTSSTGIIILCHLHVRLYKNHKDDKMTQNFPPFRISVFGSLILFYCLVYNSAVGKKVFLCILHRICYAIVSYKMKCVYDFFLSSIGFFRVP